MQCLPFHVGIIKFIQLSGLEIPFLLLKRTHGPCFLFLVTLPQATLEREKFPETYCNYVCMLQLYDFLPVLRLSPKG